MHILKWYTQHMIKPKYAYILSITLIVQWGIVSAIGGASEKDFPNALYYVSFALFWAGLALLISQTFKAIAQRKK